MEIGRLSALSFLQAADSSLRYESETGYKFIFSGRSTFSLRHRGVVVAQPLTQWPPMDLFSLDSSSKSFKLITHLHLRARFGIRSLHYALAYITTLFQLQRLCSIR
jgi:hypothetical protein